MAAGGSIPIVEIPDQMMAWASLSLLKLFSAVKQEADNQMWGRGDAERSCFGFCS